MNPHATRRILAALLLAASLPSTAGAAGLADAFSEGTSFGRERLPAARNQVNEGNARARVPRFTDAPAETRHFTSPGLGAAASAGVAACTVAPGSPARYADQACQAVEFSQSNPGRRPTFTITPSDPLLDRARAIHADPQANAGNIAGTYSACAVQQVTRPDIFETRLCHQYRSVETNTCDKILVVTPVHTPGCSEGQFLTRVIADPCPACLDYLAYDFHCAPGGYRMHAFTIARTTGAVYMDLGTRYVPGALNTQIPQTPGPTRMDYPYCYQTYFSQSCSGLHCSIGAWFQNPCQGTSHYGVNTFAMPTTVSFTDRWDDRCGALEARTR